MAGHSLPLGILIAILSLVSVHPACAQSIYEAVLLENESRTPNISTNELKKVLAGRSATVVDVRTFKEYAISHIPGSVNVAGKAGSSRGEFTSDAFEIGRIVNENKSAPIVIYCAGPFCGKAQRVASDLISQGYANVRRYQLGIPVWRALGGVTEIELEGIQHVLASDKTAVLIDTRDAKQFVDDALPRARNIPASAVGDGSGGMEISKAKEDGRLPMEDHNTRIIVVGDRWSDARLVAIALTRNAFHNVTYFRGSYADLRKNLD